MIPIVNLRLFKIIHDDAISPLRRETKIHIVASAPGTTRGALDIRTVADVGVGAGGKIVSAGSDLSAD
ncbi:uncharacterized protein Bfra_003040 [Botrytis fragariae]|uniref:Uncharacterized protein n=1 Tax=Botrytis fragariae TaxID=1964551 RepID=A0A8H6AZW5_9HELO|nr:uncharacterized protein Bfra_003040 [Botrytis fragariae]KAF5876634.1 hypothetical protein Bfra_003040 [Botrytis fragariae]